MRPAAVQPYAFHVQRNSSTLINTITCQVGSTVAAFNAALQLASSSLVALSLLLAVDAHIACVAAAVFGLAYAVLAISTRNRLMANRVMSLRPFANSLRHFRRVWAPSAMSCWIGGARLFSRYLSQLRSEVELFLLSGPIVNL